MKKKTIQFQKIQFSKSTQLSSIWPIDGNLSSGTTPDRSRPGSDGNEGVLRIPQSSSITGTSTRLFSVIIQDTRWGSLTPPQRRIRCILQSQPTGQNFYLNNVALQTSICVV